MNMDIEKNEFDSKFSNVKYMSEDNAVFLTWKKFFGYDNYRNPTAFALKLLNKYQTKKAVI